MQPNETPQNYPPQGGSTTYGPPEVPLQPPQSPQPPQFAEPPQPAPFSQAPQPGQYAQPPEQPQAPVFSQSPQFPGAAQPPRKKTWVKWLVLWLAAIPLAIIITFATHFVARDTASTTKTTSSQDFRICESGETPETSDCEDTTADITEGSSATGDSPIRRVGNIVAALLGVYGIVGWIPLLIVVSRSKKA
jgi:hypothetical protein